MQKRKTEKKERKTKRHTHTQTHTHTHRQETIRESAVPVQVGVGAPNTGQGVPSTVALHVTVTSASDVFPLAHESVATLLWSLVDEKVTVRGAEAVGGAVQAFAEPTT